MPPFARFLFRLPVPVTPDPLQPMRFENLRNVHVPTRFRGHFWRGAVARERDVSQRSGVRRLLVFDDQFVSGDVPLIEDVPVSILNDEIYLVVGSVRGLWRLRVLIAPQPEPITIFFEHIQPVLSGAETSVIGNQILV